MKTLIRLKQITRHFVNKCNKIHGQGIKSAIKAIDCLAECIERVDDFVKNSSIEIDQEEKLKS